MSLEKQSAVNLRLFTFEAEIATAFAEEILKVLEGEHDLSAEQIVWWRKRAADYGAISKDNANIIWQFETQLNLQRAASIVPYQNAKLN